MSHICIFMFILLVTSSFVPVSPNDVTDESSDVNLLMFETLVDSVLFDDVISEKASKSDDLVLGKDGHLIITEGNKEEDISPK